MRYKIGDIVVVTKSGIHQDEKATVVELATIAIPNYNYYTVELQNKKAKIIIGEEDIKPYRLVGSNDKTDCECGGDKLSIPHHYDWCPEFKKKKKMKKNKKLIKLFRESAEPNFVKFLNQLEALNGKNTENYK